MTEPLSNFTTNGTVLPNQRPRISPSDIATIQLLSKGHVWILHYATPVIAVTGVFCNILLVLLLRCARFRNLSVCLYLRVFFVTNALTLICDVGVAWICQLSGTVYIAKRSDTICRVWTFLMYTIIHMPSWLVVALVADRYIFVWHSRKAVEYCTVFVAKILSCAVLIGVMAIAIHALWTFELREKGCYLPIRVGDIHILIWSWMQVTVIKLIPCVADGLLATSLLIGLCLGRARSLRSLTTNPTSVTDHDLLTTTIVVSLLFFILTVPANVYDLVEYTYLHTLNQNILFRVRIRFVGTVFKFLLDFAHGLTGISVIIVSPSVRNQLLCVFKSSRCCAGVNSNNRRLGMVLSPSKSENEEDGCNNLTNDTTPL